MDQDLHLNILPNGLRVLVEEDERFPLVSMRLYVHAGSAYEKPEEAGISHLLEHMVFKGTATRSAGQAARDIEDVGGSLNASTGFDQTIYMLDLPAKHWDLGLDVLHDLVFAPALDKEELEREKQVVLSELERSEDNPGRRLFQDMQKLVWSSTAYERPVIGYRETVKDLSQEDIFNYIQRLYQPQSMLLVICGQVKEEALLARIESLYGVQKNKTSLSPALPFSDPLGINGPQVQLTAGSWNQVYMSLAFPTHGFRSSNEQSLEILGHMLGGDRTSRFYRIFKYREKLVNEIAVSPVMLERSGMLYIYAQLAADNLPSFWRMMVAELSDLSAASFTKQELNRTKLNIEDSLFQARETLGGLASKLGYFQFFGERPEAEERYLAQLRNVDMLQIGEVSDKYFLKSSLCANLFVPAACNFSKENFLEILNSGWQDSQEVYFAQGQTKKDENQEYDMGGGRKLVLIPDKTLPYTAVSLSWPGGDMLLSSQEQGISALASRVLTQGTAKFTASQIEEFLSDRASHIDAHASRDQFTLEAKFPSRFSSDILSLFQDVVFEPAWAEDEVQRGSADQVADILEKMDQPLGLLSRHAFPFLYPDHPYGYFHFGDMQTIKATKGSALRSFWEKQSRMPWNLAVCGDFDEQKIQELAQRLSSLPVKENEQFSVPEWTTEKKMELQLKDRKQAHLLLLFPVPALGDPSNPGFALLKKVLAGQGGILFRELRDRLGLGYAVTAMLWQTAQAGFIGFYIGTDPQKDEVALEEFKNTVQKLQAKSISEKELERAKNLLQVEYYRSHQSLGSRSNEAAELLVYKKPLDFLQKTIARSQNLTVQDIQGLANQYLQWEKAYIMLVKP